MLNSICSASCVASSIDLCICATYVLGMQGCWHMHAQAVAGSLSARALIWFVFEDLFSNLTEARVIMTALFQHRLVLAHECHCMNYMCSE